MDSDLHQNLQRIKADLRKVIATENPDDPIEDKLSSMFNVANKDIIALLPRQNLPDTGTNRRALVRSIFAFVESMLFAMKQQILEARHAFTQGELSLLREEDYELCDKGEVRVKTARLTLKNNLKFTFASWAKATATKCKLDLSDTGWREFQAALKVRDRLMHPKQPSDLEVADKEIESATTAYFWFYKNYVISLSQPIIAHIQHLKATGDWHKILPEDETDTDAQPTAAENEP